MNTDKDNPALSALRHHVTGAIERGEKKAIAEIPPIDITPYLEQVSGPGKFEGESPATAYLWQLSLDGSGGEIVASMDEDGYYAEQIAGSDFTAEELAAFPELDSESEYELRENSNGFVSLITI